MRRLALVTLSLAAGGTPTDEDLGVCLDDVLVEPFPVNETPPLPGDPCADPASQIATFAETNSRTNAEAAAATRARLLDPGRITVVTCGTGGPIPSDRVQACTAVFVGGQFPLFDAGDGAQPSMEALGLPVTDLTTMFLTHFHSDHMADVGEVMSRSWILGRTKTFTIHGGPAIHRVVDGFNLIYTPDDAYRIAHHGEEVLPPMVQASEAIVISDVPVEGKVVYDVDGVVVKAFPVDHSPVDPALGYRVEYGGRSVGISGDTIDTPGLRALAQGVDVLVSEVIDLEIALETSCGVERAGDDRNAQILRDVRTYHIGTEALADVVVEAGVGRLVLTHIVPPLPEAQAQIRFVQPISALFDGEVIAANDGTEIVIEL